VGVRVVAWKAPRAAAGLGVVHTAGAARARSRASRNFFMVVLRLRCRCFEGWLVQNAGAPRARKRVSRKEGRGAGATVRTSCGVVRAMVVRGFV
jgi:hypothetical protein